jgi:SpoVK/Ycf46/Vps4 family AAA+-type ATPase
MWNSIMRDFPGATIPNFSIKIDAIGSPPTSIADPAEAERRKEAEALRAEDENRRAREKLECEEVAARRPVEKYLLKAEHQIDWSDIVGNEEAHKAMIEAIEFPVKHGDLYKFYGKKLTKGILLKGPPGCGKTMLGKAAASVIAKLHGKQSSSLMSVKATELQQPFVGQTEQIIRDIFAYARAYKALHGHQIVVFIDEADALLPSRDGIGTRRAMSWEESNVSTFLTEMDGLEESGALVILATNRPHAIDSAVLRDGRCDRKITVRRPTEQAAKIIFQKAIESAPVDGDRGYLVEYAMQEFFSPLRHILSIKTNLGTDFMNLGHIVSGAMIVGLVERAKANAFHRDIEASTRTGITERDILAAIDSVQAENKDRPDVYALKDLVDSLGNIDSIEIKASIPEIKYAGAGTGTLQ